MCTCYNNIIISVIDRGKPVNVFARIEDVEQFWKLDVVKGDPDSEECEYIDARHDKEVLSDEAVDQVVAHVRELAAKRMLPCCCSGGGESPYCACRDLSPDFIHPRKGLVYE